MFGGEPMCLSCALTLHIYGGQLDVEGHQHGDALDTGSRPASPTWRRAREDKHTTPHETFVPDERAFPYTYQS